MAIIVPLIADIAICIFGSKVFSYFHHPSNALYTKHTKIEICVTRGCREYIYITYKQKHAHIYFSKNILIFDNECKIKKENLLCTPTILCPSFPIISR